MIPDLDTPGPPDPGRDFGPLIALLAFLVAAMLLAVSATRESRPPGQRVPTSWSP